MIKNTNQKVDPEKFSSGFDLAFGEKNDSTTAPIRVQRKRTKGWKMPSNTVYVGRPTKWGNPIKWSDYTNLTELSKETLIRWSVNDYEALLSEGLMMISVDDVQRELKGKNLACWCRDGAPCHADVLLKVANQ